MEQKKGVKVFILTYVALEIPLSLLHIFMPSRYTHSCIDGTVIDIIIFTLRFFSILTGFFFLYKRITLLLLAIGLLTISVFAEYQISRLFSFSHLINQDSIYAVSLMLGLCLIFLLFGSVIGRLTNNMPSFAIIFALSAISFSILTNVILFPINFRENNYASMVADAKNASTKEESFFADNRRYFPMPPTKGPTKTRIDSLTEIGVSRGNIISIEATDEFYKVIVHNKKARKHPEAKRKTPLILTSDGKCAWDNGAGPEC